MNPSEPISVYRRIGIVALLLLAIAYTSHLGYRPIDTESDEPIRALVALEMMISGDYLTPTLNGELYLVKPPLYNWIIASSFRVFGNYSSFALRFPMLLSIFVLGLVTFYFVRKFYNERVAWLASLMLITNGRILIYDSLLGYIDICYAALTVVGFMFVYKYGERSQWVKLFITTWLITTLGYMMKGYSSLLFHGFTILAYLLYTRNFKKLFHWANIAGALVFALVVGSYYYVYFQRNPISPETLFVSLFRENSKSTAIGKSAGRTIAHFFTYPFELFYHYAPWMIVSIALMRRDVLVRLKAQPFMLFCAVTFLANIVIYWLSPDVMARYIFMLLALLYTVLAYFYLELTDATDWRRKWIDGFFIFVTAAVLLASFILPFHPATNKIEYATIRSVVLISGFAIVLWLMIRRRINTLMYFTVALALFRLGFDWFVLEQRGLRFVESDRWGREIARMTEGTPIYILGKSIHHQNSVIGSKNGISYNISVYKQDIVRFKSDKDTTNFFLVDKSKLDGTPYETYYRFKNFMSEDTIYLLKFKAMDAAGSR